MNEIIRWTVLATGAVVQLVAGDLTEEQVDAIVNAANAYLAHGGGVAGAISRRGGPQIQAESDAWVRTHGPVAHDRPAVTSGGDLACRYVIHAVGPVWGEGDEDARLAVAVRGALEKAGELKLASLSLPAISTGIYGFPKERAAQVILSATRDYLNHHTGSLLKVRIVAIDQATLAAFHSAWAACFPGSELSDNNR